MPTAQQSGHTMLQQQPPAPIRGSQFVVAQPPTAPLPQPATAPLPVQPAPVTPAQPPLTTGQLTAAVRPSRAPIIIVALLAVVAVAGGIGFVVLSRSGKEPGPEPVAAQQRDAGSTATAPLGGPDEPVHHLPLPVAVEDAGEAVAEVVDAGEAVEQPPFPPVEEEDAGEATEQPPFPPVEGPPLAGVARLIRQDGVYSVTNKSGKAWTSCTVVAPGQRSMRIARFANQASTDVPLRALKNDPGAEATTNELVITCDQGVARLKLR